MSIIIAENIRKSYKSNNEKIEVLSGANITINKGEFVALVGPSGSGKTTMLQICGLIENMDSGKIIFNDMDISHISPKKKNDILKKDISFIYQMHHLFPEFTALENIIIPQLIAGINEVEAKKNAKKLLEKINLLDKANVISSVLSGGEKQRIAILRAMSIKPKFILADEPTGNLDWNIAENVFNFLYSEAKTYNTSVLFITHNHELAKKCDRILSMQNGLII